MSKACDPIMDEVHAIRNALSAEGGHDAATYFSLVQNEKREAERLGMSYFEYCLAMVDRESPPKSQKTASGILPIPIRNP